MSSATNGIGSITLQQRGQEPIISCVRFTTSGDSFFSLYFYLTSYYLLPQLGVE